MKILFFSIFSSLFFYSSSQINFNTIGVSYSQNFNGITITGSQGGTQTWTNNSTLSGWYMQQSTNVTTSVVLELSPTSGTPLNNGGHYIVNNSTDISIGSRASGSYSNSSFGVRFKNNTGTVIRSLRVVYSGEQHSIAENLTNINNLQFHYQKVNTPSTITSLSSGTWTALTALDFTQLYSSANSAGLGGTACTGNSAQCLALNGNSASNRGLKVANFDVTLNAGDEIMLRWLDVDNAANDHHLQIDDVVVTPFDDITSVVLPIELAFFEATCNSINLNFTWQTLSERDNDFFVLEGSMDGFTIKELSKIDGAGNTTSSRNYGKEVENLNYTYYRLKQVDFNGDNSFSKWISNPCEEQGEVAIYPNPTNGILNLKGVEKYTTIKICNEIGQFVKSIENHETSLQIDLTEYAFGVYYLVLTNDSNHIHKKIVFANEATK